MFDDLSATMQLIIQCCAILLSLFFLVSWYVWYDTEPYAKHTNKRIPVCGHKQSSFGTLSLMHTSYIISSAMQNLVILSFYSKSYCITNIVNFVSIFFGQCKLCNLEQKYKQRVMYTINNQRSSIKRMVPPYLICFTP